MTKVETHSPKPTRSLRTTLSAAFLLLVLVILLVANGLGMYFSFQTQKRLIAGQQTLIAKEAADTVKNFIRRKIDLLKDTANFGNLIAVPKETQDSILAKSLRADPSFRQLILMDTRGRELTYVSRASEATSRKINVQLKIDEVIRQAKENKEYLGSIYIYETTSEPMMIMAVPAENVFGDFQGALAAEVNLKFMWDVVGGLKVGDKGLAYVVDNQGNLIACGDTSRVLKGENLSRLKDVAEFVSGKKSDSESLADTSKGIQGTTVVSTFVSLDRPDWAVVVELPVMEAYQSVIRAFELTALVMLIIIALAFFAGIYLSKRITKPIINLRDAAIKIGAGQLDTKIDIGTKDEIGQLADSFNKMADELSRTLVSKASLEQALSTTKTLMEQIPVGLIVVGKDRKIRLLNPLALKMFGAGDYKDVVGATCHKHICPADIGKCPVLDLGDAVNNSERILLTVDGGKIPVLKTVRTITMDGEEVLLEAFVDLTERKQSEKEKEKLQSELVQSSKMAAVGTLSGGIAHDFNNILAAVMGNAQLIKISVPSESDTYKMAEVIEKSAQKGADLANKLLVVSRRTKITAAPISLNNTINEIIGLLNRTIEKMITIRTQLAPDLWMVEADATQIYQVLLNICINAKEAMMFRPGGKLVIETHNKEIPARDELNYPEARPGKYVTVSISDTGIGMDAETISRVFEPFFTTKDKSVGHGLGLAMALGIVKNHNGFIKIYSEKDKGSCFMVYIPALEGRKTQEPKPKEASALNKGTGTILMVDDEPALRDMGKLMLERFGYRVILAQDGKEAAAIYQQKSNEINLVILDYIMPGWSGKETFDELRKINPAIKALISSGYSLDLQAEDLIQEGIKGFIQKPFTIKELLEEIKKILAPDQNTSGPIN